MRILFLGNNWLGWKTLEWLVARGEDVVGLVRHPEHRSRYGSELESAADLTSDRIFDGSRLQEPEVLDAVRALHPDVGVSVLFGYILKPEFLESLPQGCVNLHPSYLPYNRGAHPNVWSIVEGTPAGVTLHYLDAGVDTGPILAQERIAVEPVDTGATLYHRLERAGFELFQEAWPKFRAGRLEARKQTADEGSYHRASDLDRLDRIDLNRTYRARDLINLIRARTFPPYSGAWFEEAGRRVYLRLELREEHEANQV